MAEAPSWTQKVPERKMSDNESHRLAQEEKELELRKKQLEDREKEIEAEKVKKKMQMRPRRKKGEIIPES